MITMDEALRLVQEEAQALELRWGGAALERVALIDAAGRVLGQSVHAPIDLPEADYSAMDGYAVRCEDVSAGARLQVVGECRTGHATPVFQPGSCLRIFTGARMPAGADAVVMQENVERSGDWASFSGAPRLGENIRRRGEDLGKGEEVLAGGVRLSPFHLGLLATAECSELLVKTRPRVAIVCTGDELRAPGSTFFGGGLAESNSVALAALCRAAGAEVTRTAIVRDEPEALKSALEQAQRRCDVVLTVGGVSVGDHDLVAPVLEQLGARLIFHKVKIKPGKPVLLAALGDSLVLGLPGNPSSAQVIFTVFGLPLLRALGGDTSAPHPERRARLTHAVRQKPGRRGFLRAKLSAGEVTLLGNQASGASTSMAWANALVVLSEEREEFAAGDEVPVIAYSDFC